MLFKDRSELYFFSDRLTDMYPHTQWTKTTHVKFAGAHPQTIIILNNTCLFVAETNHMRAQHAIKGLLGDVDCRNIL